jgi:zinc protease
MSEHLQQPILTTGDVTTLRLDNGLLILAREMHASPTVTTMIWYRVGSRHEQAGATGRSHFLEHMLFKGTDTYGKGEIDLLTMKNGGSNNAFTSYDYTAYYFNFASDRWQTALDIEAHRMRHTIFDSEEFEAERRVVIEELKAGLDQPWGALMQEFNRVAYGGHPYGNPVIGWLPDLETASVTDMKEYYRQHYCPSNATLVLVGDFDVSEALERARARFADIPASEAPGTRYEREPPQEAERRFEFEWRSEVPRLVIGYHAPPIGHVDSYALQVLAAVLGEGKASRLYQRLVEGDRTATFASAEYAEAHDDTLFMMRSEGRGAGQAPDRMERAVHEEVQRIAEEGVTPHELERARHQIEAHFVFSMERPLDQAMLLGQVQTLTTLDYIDQYLPRISQVDSADVRSACRRYLVPSRRTVGWMLPDAEHRCSEVRT